MSRKNTGFTLVEIMIVVAIIGLLAAIAVPSFMKSRNSARRNACINNLRQIDGAKDTYALEYGGTNNQSIAWTEAGIYLKDFSNKLYCPAASAAQGRSWSNYTLNAIGVNPECTIDPGSSASPLHSMRYKVK